MKLIKKKGLWIGLVLVVALAGGGYYYFSTSSDSSQGVAASAELQTAVVRRGDLEISTTGAGVFNRRR